MPAVIRRESERLFEALRVTSAAETGKRKKNCFPCFVCVSYVYILITGSVDSDDDDDYYEERRQQQEDDEDDDRSTYLGSEFFRSDDDDDDGSSSEYDDLVDDPYICWICRMFERCQNDPEHPVYPDYHYCCAPSPTQRRRSHRSLGGGRWACSEYCQGHG